MTESIPVVRGENVWRMIRTDRDQATREEVLGMVGPALHHILHEAGEQFAEIDPWQIVIRTTPDGKELHEWRIGAARPIVAVEAKRGRMAAVGLPGIARVLWKRAHYTGPGLAGVTGARPWWILVRFWWRQDDTTISSPGYRVNEIGWHGSGPDDLQKADWMIDEAIVPLVEDTDPGGQTFGDEMIPRVVKTVKDAIKFGGGLLVVGALVAAAVYFGPSFLARSRKAGAK